MTNGKELNKAIEESGFKKSYIAKELGITPTSLSMKLCNKTEFKSSEIEYLCSILNITSFDRLKAIFFAHEVDLQST